MGDMNVLFVLKARATFQATAKREGHDAVGGGDQYDQSGDQAHMMHDHSMMHMMHDQSGDPAHI